MNKSGPIVIVNDHIEDLQIFSQALSHIKANNKVLYFGEAQGFLEFLRNGKELVFFILCNINMRGMNGFELNDQINKDKFLRSRAIPFLFFSESTDRSQALKAYDMNMQGYFIKPSNLQGIIKMLRIIINYWNSSSHPTL